MIKGKEYSFNEVASFAAKNNYNEIEYGKPVVGENIVVLKHNEKDLTVTFVLIGINSKDLFLYECVYSDLK